MTNPDNPNSPTDTGTPVQDYVGPQAEVTLPPCQPAPLMQQKQDDSFSAAEVQAIRTAAGQEVDAKLASSISMTTVRVLIVVISATLIGSWSYDHALFGPAMFTLVGLVLWFVANLMSASRISSSVGELALRHSVEENNAVLSMPRIEATPSTKGNPYIRNFRISAIGVVVLEVLLAAFWLVANLMQLEGMSFLGGSLLGLMIGIGVGTMIHYLTLCRGWGRLSEAERQRQIDKLVSGWLA